VERKFAAKFLRNSNLGSLSEDVSMVGRFADPEFKTRQIVIFLMNIFAERQLLSLFLFTIQYNSFSSKFLKRVNNISVGIIRNYYYKKIEYKFDKVLQRQTTREFSI